jgi:transposase
MARKQHEEATKAAIMAALLAGQSLSQVAKEYKIPKSTIANWSAEAHAFGTVPNGNGSRERIGALLLEYLEATLSTLIMQQKVFANAEWLLKQSAAEAATLHGVSVDKAVRLLEGLADTPDARDTPDAD